MSDVSGPAQPVAPGVWRVPLAGRTPPPYDHTNSWIVADGGVAWWIDAGFDPDDASVVAAVRSALAAAGVRTLKGVLLTHTHADHVRGVPALRRLDPELPVLVHPVEAERVPGDGPVRPLQHGRRLIAGDRELLALATPGHSPGHLAFWIEAASVAVVGDLLAAETSVFVGWPDGDVTAYLDSLAAVADLGAEVLAPGHGRAVVGRAAVRHRIAEVIDHRRAREAQIVAALAEAGVGSPTSLLDAVYPDLDPALATLARRSLHAHLLKLLDDGRVERAEPARTEAQSGTPTATTAQAAPDGTLDDEPTVRPVR